MRKIWLLAGVALTISACNKGGTAADTNDVNAVTADNMMIDENVAVDQNGMVDDANGAIDANTQNLLIQDATTHDHDTNLANGI